MRFVILSVILKDVYWELSCSWKIEIIYLDILSVNK